MADAFQEIEDLRNRIEWIDEERRKSARRLVELEQRLALNARELETRDRRIEALEKQLADATTRLNQTENVEGKLEALRQELVNMLNQQNDRRVASEGEMMRARQLEAESFSREIAEIRQELPALDRLGNELAQRRTEDNRLAKLITTLQNRFSTVDNRLEALNSNAAFLEESLKQNGRQIAQVEADVLEINRRRDAQTDRIDSVAATVVRLENQVPAVQNELSALRLQIRDWLEKAKLADYDRSRKLDQWAEVLESFREEMNAFQQERFAQHEQLKQARATLDTFGEWRQQQEVRQREADELTRLEINRMKSRWETFRADSEKYRRQLSLENEQFRTTSGRREAQLQSQLDALTAQLESLEQEKEMLLRIQAAQSDALKRFPLLWMEEVDKAIANDPNRRRQPTMHHRVNDGTE